MSTAAAALAPPFSGAEADGSRANSCRQNRLTMMTKDEITGARDRRAGPCKAQGFRTAGPCLAPSLLRMQNAAATCPKGVSERGSEKSEGDGRRGRARPGCRRKPQAGGSARHGALLARACLVIHGRHGERDDCDDEQLFCVGARRCRKPATTQRASGDKTKGRAMCGGLLDGPDLAGRHASEAQRHGARRRRRRRQERGGGGGGGLAEAQDA